MSGGSDDGTAAAAALSTRLLSAVGGVGGGGGGGSDSSSTDTLSVVIGSAGRAAAAAAAKRNGAPNGRPGAAAAGTPAAVLQDDTVVCAHVLQYSTLDELLHVALVCRTWSRAALRSSAWRAVIAPQGTSAAIPFRTHLSAAVESFLRAHPDWIHRSATSDGLDDERGRRRYGAAPAPAASSMAPMVPGVAARLWMHTHWTHTTREWSADMGLPIAQADWRSALADCNAFQNAPPFPKLYEGSGFHVALHAPGLPWRAAARTRRDAEADTIWWLPPRDHSDLDADALAEDGLPPRRPAVDGSPFALPGISADTVARADRDAQEAKAAHVGHHDYGAAFWHHTYLHAGAIVGALSTPRAYVHHDLWASPRTTPAERRDVMSVYLTKTPAHYVRPVDPKQYRETPEQEDIKVVGQALATANVLGFAGALMTAAGAVFGMVKEVDRDRGKRPWTVTGFGRTAHVVAFDRVDLALADAERNSELAAAVASGARLKGYGFRHALPNPDNPRQPLWKWTDVSGEEVRAAYGAVDPNSARKLFVQLRRQLYALVVDSYTEQDTHITQTRIKQRLADARDVQHELGWRTGVYALWLLWMFSVLVCVRVDWPHLFNGGTSTSTDDPAVPSVGTRVTSWLLVAIPLWFTCLVVLRGTWRALCRRSGPCCGCAYTVPHSADTAPFADMYARAHLWRPWTWSGASKCTAREHARLSRQRACTERLWLYTLALVCVSVAWCCALAPLAMAQVPLYGHAIVETDTDDDNPDSALTRAAVSMRQLTVLPLVVSLAWAFAMVRILGTCMPSCMTSWQRMTPAWFGLVNDNSNTSPAEHAIGDSALYIATCWVQWTLMSVKWCTTDPGAASVGKWIQLFIPVWCALGIVVVITLGLCLVKPCTEHVNHAANPHHWAAYEWRPCRGQLWWQSFIVCLLTSVVSLSGVALAMKADGTLPLPSELSFWYASVVAFPIHGVWLAACIVATYAFYEHDAARDRRARLTPHEIDRRGY